MKKGSKERNVGIVEGQTATIHLEILRLSMAIVVATVLLSLVFALVFLLLPFHRSLDGNLMNSASMIA